MVIEELERGDIAALVCLWENCGLTRPWNDPVADAERALAGPSSTIFGGRGAGGALTGSVMVGHDGHRGWVYYLAVASDKRGRGYGRALMQAVEDWLKARSIPKIQLMVREDNEEALAFYAALGLERQAVVTLGRFF